MERKIWSCYCHLYSGKYCHVCKDGSGPQYRARFVCKDGSGPQYRARYVCMNGVVHNIELDVCMNGVVHNIELDMSV